MVYAFCGAVISFIDRDWVRREHVLDLITLDGDHSGKTVGKLVFKRLKKNKLADKLSKFIVISRRTSYVTKLLQWRLPPTMLPAMAL